MGRTRYTLLRGLFLTVGHLPLKVHHFLSPVLAFLAEKVVKYRREVVEGNLRICFPEKTDSEIARLRHGFYRHFADLIAETIWFGACSNRRFVRSRILETTNPEQMQRIAALQTNTVMLASHFGNWELIGGIPFSNYTGREFPITEDNVCVVYRRLSDKDFDKIMRLNRIAPLLRPEAYSGYVESEELIRHMLRHRSDGRNYLCNTDQRPYFEGSGNVSVDFFGTRVPTMSGVVAIARKFGLSVVYMSMPKASRGHYRLTFVPICDDASKMSTEEIMQRYYDLLEADIRKQPECYLWSHRRWA